MHLRLLAACPDLKIQDLTHSSYILSRTTMSHSPTRLSTPPCLFCGSPSSKLLRQYQGRRGNVSHTGESFANVNFVLRCRCFPSQIQSTLRFIANFGEFCKMRRDDIVHIIMYTKRSRERNNIKEKDMRKEECSGRRCFASPHVHPWPRSRGVALL
jgi:hypothetical protein